MSKSRRGTAVAVASVLALASVSFSTAEATSVARPHSNAVLRWNAYAGEAAVAACLSPVTNPLHESRMYATMHVAVHDALQAIHRTSEPYAFDARVGIASARAAVSGAAHTALVGVLDDISDVLDPACLESALEIVDDGYARVIAKLPDGPRTERGLDLGERAAAAILELRRRDGSDTPLVVADYPPR